MIEKKCFAMFCQNCQLFGCTPRLKMMLTYHISHEKNFSTALYVPGRSGVKTYFCKIADLSSRKKYDNTHFFLPIKNILEFLFQVF